MKSFVSHSGSVIVGLILCAVVLASIACKKETPPPTRIGMNVWPGYEPLFLARNRGHLSENDFRLVEFSNGSDVSQAFRNGTLEAACITLDEAFYCAQDGVDLVVFLVMDESCGADVVLARPEIKSVADLRGKRVAVEVSAVGAYMLTRTLQHAGLMGEDITPVYLPIDKHFSAYKDGTVDAVVTFEPVRTRLLALGAVDIFNSSKIPGEIVDVLVLNRQYLREHPERGLALRKAWFAALEEIRNSPRSACEVMCVRAHMTPDEFQESLRGLILPDEKESRLLLEGPTPKLLQSAERLQNIMRESGLLHREIALKPLFVLPETFKTAN